MNLFKRTTATVALITLVSGLFSTGAYASSESQIAAANALAEAGYIVNHSTNPSAYNLNQNVLRQEIAAVARGVAGIDKKATCDNKFSDVSATTPNNWACYTVEALLDAGLIAANPTFRPEAQITKAEAIGMMVKAAFGDKYSYDSTKGTTWQEQVVEFAVSEGIVASFTNYDTPATRGFVFEAGSEAIVAIDDTVAECDEISQLLGLCDEEDVPTTGTGTNGTGSTGTGVVSSASDLMVELSPESTTAKSIPSNGTVSFGKLDFTAGNSDTLVTSVKMMRTGLGDRADFSRVWLEKDGNRVSGRQSVGSDESVYVTFSPALAIKAGETVSLDIVATLAAVNTGSQHAFTIAKSSDVVASTGIDGNFPITTSTLTTANYTVVPVTFSMAGSTSTYRAGDKNIELGQFRLQNNATNDKSVDFKSVTFRNDGTGDAAKNLSNLAVYKNGVKVSTSATVDGKNVTFTVSDKVDFGRTETYYVRADVDSVELTAGDSYTFTLRYSDDLIVDETATGFRSTITGAGISLATYNVSGGDIILSKATTSSSQTVAPGTNDVVLLDAVLKVNQAITVEDLTVNYASTNLFTSFSSLKLVVGNNVVASYTPTNAATTSFVFEGTSTISADTTLKIIANVKTNAPAGGPFVLSNIAITDFALVEYASNGNAVAAGQKVGSANGVSTTIGSATLTMTRNDGIANQNVTIGSNTQTLLKFAARANDVSAINISKLTFAPVGPSNVNTANVTNVKLLINGTVVSTKNMSSGNADFNDINVAVAKNSDVQVEVVADFSTAITPAQVFQLGLSAIEARDSNSIALTGGSITNPSNGVLYTFSGAGTATLAVNSSTVNSSVLTPSSNETEVARFTLGAQNDELKLTDLYVYNTGSADLSSSIKSIGLYDVNNVKLAGGSVLGTGTVQFSLGSTSAFKIAKNTSNSVVVVKASFNDVTDAAQTNKTVQLSIGSLVSTVAGTVNGVRLVSESTGDTTTTVTGTAVAKSHLLVRSKPVVAVSTAATLTTHTFTVTADANNRIILDGASIDLQNPTANTGSYILYEDQEINGNEIATGSLVAGSNPLSLTSLNTEVSAGTSKTFILKISGNVLNGFANQKRIAKISDVSYIDVMNTGGDVTVSSVSTYSNVGLPTVESTFTY
ncbi:MAG: S-layer homology domain-containing protein [Candidatus Gracilibacteria bacterium]|nr:S-layer homology domain-containing protein [Candidatus Gracilibacteria bacterium]